MNSYNSIGWSGLKLIIKKWLHVLTKPYATNYLRKTGYVVGGYKQTTYVLYVAKTGKLMNICSFYVHLLILYGINLKKNRELGAFSQTR